MRPRLAAALLLLLLPAAAAAQAPGSFPPGAAPDVQALDAALAAKRDTRLFPSVVDGIATAAAVTELLGGGGDASGFIQAAIARGGTAHLPCGFYRLDHPVTVGAANTGLVGEGAGCTIIQVTFAEGDVLAVHAANPTVAGILFVTSIRRTGGALLHLVGTSNARLQDVKALANGGGTWADILVIEGGAVTTKLNDWYFGPATGDCIRVAGRALDTFIGGPGNSVSCGTALHLRSASGVHLGPLDLIGSTGPGVLIDPVAAAHDSVDAVYGGPVWSDTSAGPGMQVSGDGRVTELHPTDLWVSRSGTVDTFTKAQTLNRPSPGLVLDNPLLDVASFAGVLAKGNGGPGIDIRQGRHIVFTAPQATMNGASFGVAPPGSTVPATARHPGIRIGPLATFVQVAFPYSGRGGWEDGMGLPLQQDYGLHRIAGKPGATITVIGGQWDGNVTGGHLIEKVAGDHVVDLGN